MFTLVHIQNTTAFCWENPMACERGTQRLLGGKTQQISREKHNNIQLEKHNNDHREKHNYWREKHNNWREKHNNGGKTQLLAEKHKDYWWEEYYSWPCYWTYYWQWFIVISIFRCWKFLYGDCDSWSCGRRLRKSDMAPPFYNVYNF